MRRPSARPPVGTRTERHVVRPVDRTLAERPEINLARFREVTMDDPVLARGLITSFGESGEHALRDIETGMAEKDFARVQRGAHTLVGASANMGATRLEAAAVAMERAAGQRDEAAIDNLLGAARLRLRGALTELRALYVDLDKRVEREELYDHHHQHQHWERQSVV
jgi:HPt (histidine-containing phosphotransfer) domain-containing protein